MKLNRFAGKLLVLPLAAVAALSGCGKTSTPAPTSGSAPATTPNSPVVARVGDSVITAAELRRKLGEQSPYLQARYEQMKNKKEFLDNLIRFELLAQDAKKRGIDREPKVQDEINKVLVSQLTSEMFDASQEHDTDAQLKAYYDQHIAEFHQPARIRARQIFLAAPAADRAARARAKRQIASFLAKLKTNQLEASPQSPRHDDYQPTMFQDLARRFSDDPMTKGQGGDMLYLSQADMASHYSQPFADAVFALDEEQPLSGVIADEKGYHLALLTQRQLAVDLPFDKPEVKRTIHARLAWQHRMDAFNQYMAKLKADAHIQVDEKVLASVEPPAPGNPPPNTGGLVPPPVPPRARVVIPAKAPVVH